MKSHMSCLCGGKVKKTHRSLCFFSIANFDGSCRTPPKKIPGGQRAIQQPAVHKLFSAVGVESQLFSASVDT